MEKRNQKYAKLCHVLFGWPSIYGQNGHAGSHSARYEKNIFNFLHSTKRPQRWQGTFYFLHFPTYWLYVAVAVNNLLVSKNNTIGKFNRPGIELESGVCGALIAFLNVRVFFTSNEL